MKKYLVLMMVLCVLASLGIAKSKKIKAAPNSGEGLEVEAIGSPNAPSAPAVSESEVTLKDGQKASGLIQGYDSYFLDLKTAKGAVFHIPWPEVEGVRRGGQAEEWSQAYLVSEKNVVVGTLMTPLSRDKAFYAAIFPGFLIHGLGHFQARDSDRFYALAGAEVFGLMVGAFGMTEMNAPVLSHSTAGVPGDNDNMARALAWGGVSVFALSWLYDVGFAASAADRFNRERGLVLNVEPVNNGVMLGMSRKF
jgi:hypothetical protein